MQAHMYVDCLPKCGEYDGYHDDIEKDKLNPDNHHERNEIAAAHVTGSLSGRLIGRVEAATVMEREILHIK